MGPAAFAATSCTGHQHRAMAECQPSSSLHIAKGILNCAILSASTGCAQRAMTSDEEAVSHTPHRKRYFSVYEPHRVNTCGLWLPALAC